MVLCAVTWRDKITKCCRRTDVSRDLNAVNVENQVETTFTHLKNEKNCLTGSQGGATPNNHTSEDPIMTQFFSLLQRVKPDWSDKTSLINQKVLVSLNTVHFLLLLMSNSVCSWFCHTKLLSQRRSHPMCHTKRVVHPISPCAVFLVMTRLLLCAPHLSNSWEEPTILTYSFLTSRGTAPVVNHFAEGPSTGNCCTCHLSLISSDMSVRAGNLLCVFIVR